MTYVMANIHGCCSAYTRMLDQIGFCDDDVLYVLGDAVGYGKRPAELLRDMMMRPNVYPILGEHEMTTLKMLRGITSGKLENADSKFINAFHVWLRNGGKPMAEAFRTMNDEDKESMIDYLMEFACYEDVEVGGSRYILVHAGLENYRPDRPLDDYSPEELTLASPDFQKGFTGEGTLVVGHTPTIRIDPSRAGKIYFGKGIIDLDCGAGRPNSGGHLGCLRLEDHREFYI